MLDGRSSSVLCLLHSLLYGSHGSVQVNNDALARTPRFGDAVAAVAQATVGNLHRQCARLGTADVNRGKEVLVLVRHSYCVSSPLAIRGLGFAGALAAACGDFRSARPREADAAVLCPLLGAVDADVFDLVLAFNRVCRECAFQRPALTSLLLVTVLVAAVLVVPGLVAADLVATGFAGLGFSTNGATVFTIRVGDGLG